MTFPSPPPLQLLRTFRVRTPLVMVGAVLALSCASVHPVESPEKAGVGGAGSDVTREELQAVELGGPEQDGGGGVDSAIGARVDVEGHEQVRMPPWGPDVPVDGTALEPYFADGPWAQALERLLAGDPAGALEVLEARRKVSSEATEAEPSSESTDGDSASLPAIDPSSGIPDSTLMEAGKDIEDGPRLYLKGRIFAAAGRQEEAATAFLGSADWFESRDMDGFASYVRCLAADAVEAVESTSTPASLYRYCLESPVPVRESRVSLAAHLSRKGELEEALELLRPWLGATPSAEALVAAADVSEKAGKVADAIAYLRRAWIEDPASPFAAEARTRLDALAPKHAERPIGAEHHLDRAERLHDVGDLRGARRHLTAARIDPVCTGAKCTPRSCGDFDAPLSIPKNSSESESSESAEDDVAEPTPFRLHELHDPEGVEGPLPLPQCAIAVVREPADPLSCRAAFLDARLLRRARQHTRGMNLFRAVYEHCADPSLRVRSLFLGQASASAVRHADAIGLAWALALQFPDSTLGDDALLTASNIARRAGDRVTERALLRHIVTAFPSGDMRGEALFRLFWSYRSEGTPEHGLWALSLLESEHDVGEGGVGADAERGRYWWGRTVAVHAVEEDRPRGLRKLLELARERPLTYYGLLARSFLAEEAPELLESGEQPVVAQALTALRPGPLANDPRLRTGVELLRLGFTDEAREALTSIDLSNLDREDPRAREAYILVAELIARTGDVRQAHSMIRMRLPAWIRAGDEPLSAVATRLAYPLAFREYIARHARDHGVHADFIQGLMREESALDPRALSPVGARGLTQLMPATARQVAQSLGIRRLDLEALWEPDTNIRLGANYLGRMLRRFGHPAIAAAAYNAGPTAVSRWLNQRGDQPLDEFVEEIPYAETKGYVKRVLRSYATYRFLYGEPGEQLLSVRMSLKDDDGDR